MWYYMLGFILCSFNYSLSIVVVVFCNIVYAESVGLAYIIYSLSVVVFFFGIVHIGECVCVHIYMLTRQESKTKHFGLDN